MLSLEQLRSAASEMRRHAVKPFKVETKAQARAMTQDDPCGRKWKVGDEYYKLYGATHKVKL